MLKFNWTDMIFLDKKLAILTLFVGIFFFLTLPSGVLITPDDLVFIAGWHNRCEATARCNICLILPPESSSAVFTSFHNWVHLSCLYLSDS